MRHSAAEWEAKCPNGIAYHSMSFDENRMVKRAVAFQEKDGEHFVIVYSDNGRAFGVWNDEVDNWLTEENSPELNDVSGIIVNHTCRCKELDIRWE